MRWGEVSLKTVFEGKVLNMDGSGVKVLNVLNLVLKGLLLALKSIFFLNVGEGGWGHRLGTFS